MADKQTRRKFLITSAAATGGIAVTAAAQDNVTNRANRSISAKLMPERILGRTGEKVPIFGLGGAGQTPLSWEGKESDAIAIIEKALELGIRYFDTAASYGPSEDYLGKVLPPYRGKIFLASKTDQRNRDGAWRELERSLKRLNTDYLDLWQLHHVSFPDQLDTIFSTTGAIKAVEEAIDQKLIRFVGISGHHQPEVIADGLRRYPFHTALIPINAADQHHPNPFVPTVLPVAQANNVGVIAMKVPAYGRLFQPGGLEGMEQAMGYSLSVAGVHCCVIAAETVEQLEQNVQVARAFVPLSQAQMKVISQLTANIWQDSTFFRVWT